MSAIYIVGIDEAGRGPLAGPVSVGVLMLNKKVDKKFLRGIKDSKKLSESMREEWFNKALEMKAGGVLDYRVALVSEKVIDKNGIVEAIKIGIEDCLKKLKVPKHSEIYLDGGLRAPKNFKKQKTIIKGDEKIPVISLASIMAKVTRDRYMKKIGMNYPEYGFEEHKGYGTAKHIKAIKKFGISKIHRKTYLTNII
ncbi:MAG: ribonuclease HII [Minisyncoccia bacterium]